MPEEVLGDVGRAVVTAPGTVVGTVVGEVGDGPDGILEVPAVEDDNPEDPVDPGAPTPRPPPAVEQAATRPTGSMASTARRRTVGASSPELTWPP
ncbi:hypothetical protein FHX52_2954 [Humibacillus xanthopallidus]|uniref:Uncharacterized protein n=1 Tax=Humibacillus xanthopallidus TaxID=412689 RepID=A0A543PQ85_9MICO|nr:hypothetical protein FHX52_2954 [Humibacillus xanthopallidus]